MTRFRTDHWVCILVAAGALLASMTSWGNQDDRAKRAAEELRIKNLQVAAANFEQAAEGYLYAASNRLAVAQNHHLQADALIRDIESGTQTNFPHAWRRVATLKRSAGGLERQVANNYLVARRALQRAYDAHRKIGNENVSLLTRLNALDYKRFMDRSAASYATAVEFFKAAGDALEVASLYEQMAGEDMQRANEFERLAQ